MNAPEKSSADPQDFRATRPEFQEILAELEAHEPIFHRPEFGTTRADFERMTSEDFWETGSSGRRYSRQMVLDVLEKRYAVPHEDVWETSEFQCRRLAGDTYLLTYTLKSGEIPRLCRGGSSSLTFRGVHPRNSKREPTKAHAKEQLDGPIGESKPLGMGVQIPCGLYPEVSPQGVV